MKYSKDDRVKLDRGIFSDFHHIEAGMLGHVTSDERNGKVMVQFETTPRACGLVIVDVCDISPNDQAQARRTEGVNCK